MARIDTGTWVLIADGEKALFLENVADHADPNLQVRSEARNDNPPTREQGTDAPGRRSDGGPGHRSAVGETDWHRIGKERFADKVAETLYKAVHRGDFPWLVLVAPPQILGEIRAIMHKEVAERVIAEIPKTLTNHALRDIERIVKADVEAVD